MSVEESIFYPALLSFDSFRGKEMEMLKLLAEHGPVAVAVDATTWHNYVGGIIQFHCSANINHAVQIVGYDLTGRIASDCLIGCLGFYLILQKCALLSCVLYRGTRLVYSSLYA